MKKSNLTNLFTKLLFVGILAVTVISCNTEKKVEETEGDEFDEAAAELQGKVEEVIYDIPAPSEVPFLLEATGADYYPGLENSIDKVDTYTKSNNKTALNLGVYATDIGYMVSYGKVQEALKYFESSKILADQLGVTNAIDVTLIQKFEKNLSSKDTLAGIINNAIKNADKFLKDNDLITIPPIAEETWRMIMISPERQLISPFFLGGEVLQIAYPTDEMELVPLIKIIAEQQKPLQDIIALLKSVEKEDWTIGLVNSLEALESAYDDLAFDSKLESNQAGDLLNDKTFQRIMTMLGGVRQNITY